MSEKVVKAKNPENITLNVMRQDNAIFTFEIMKKSPMVTIMKAYCDREGYDLSTPRFRFDGLQINEADTPSSIGLVEGDVIEVYQLQIGG